jgi:aryl-alcohol dehydrogenase-like predicted oxidoreductase
MIRLVLGTATFGTGYGIANQGIRINPNTVQELIKTAEKFGITDFDTAPGYGLAEDLLGKFLSPKLSPKISSKISKENCKSVILMIASVKETLRRTNVDTLENLYLHDSELLSETEATEAMSGLDEIKNLGLAKNVGISTYDLDTLLRFKDRFPQLTAFQVPENILDRRMINSQALFDLSNEGNTFFVRSLFLQGLILMSPEEIPKELKAAKMTILKLRAFSDSNSISPLAICLEYGRLIPWASGLVIGALNSTQLQQIVRAKISLPKEWETEIPILPDEIVDPRLWTK